MSFTEELIDICDRLIQHFGWKDLEEQEREWQEKGSRSISADEKLMKATFQAKSLANTNYSLAISQLYNLIPRGRGYNPGFVEYISVSQVSELTPDRIKYLTDYLYTLSDLVSLHERWEQADFLPILESIQNHELFTKKDDIEVDSSILERIHDLVVTHKNFKAYKYQDNGDQINPTDVWKISTEVGLSTDLTQWLTHVRAQQDFLNKQPDNEVFVTLFGKIDEISDVYSNWVITLHKKETIWIVTDQGSFDNPLQKRWRLSRKSVWRDRDELEDKCDLPYYLFQNLDKLRESQTRLVGNDRYDTTQRDYINQAADYVREAGWSSQQSRRFHNQIVHLMKVDLEEKNIEYDACYCLTERNGDISECRAQNKGKLIAIWKRDDQLLRIYKSEEFLFTKMKDLPGYAKLFVVLLASKLIEVLSSEDYNTPMVMLPGQHIHTKLIEGGVISTADPSHLKYWEEPHKELFKGLVDTVEDLHGHSGALMPVSYDLITTSQYYDNSWLATVDGNESMAEWIVAMNQVSVVSQRVRGLNSREDEDTKALIKMFNDRYEAVSKKVMAAKYITFKDDTHIYGSGFSHEEKGKMVNCGGVIPMKFARTQDSKLGYGIGKTGYEAEQCHFLKNEEKRVGKRVIITHYRELMYLLGVRQDQLPPYWRNYRKYNRVPYRGNSILDQVHPFTLVEDPASRRHTNGFNLLFFISNAARKLHDGPKAEMDISIPVKLKRLL